MTTIPTIPTQAVNAYYHEQISGIMQRLEQVQAWAPSERRDAILADLEMALDDIMSCVEVGAEMETVAHEGEIEISERLDDAIDTAQQVGAVIVTGAHDLARELDRIAPGCLTTRNGVEVRTVRIDGGELRMTRQRGSYQARIVWGWL